MLKNLNTINKLPLIILFLAVFFLFKTLTSKKELNTPLVSSDLKKEAVEKIETSAHKESKHIHSHKSDHHHKSKTKKYDYSFEKEKIFLDKMIKGLPESKNDLLNFIQSKNPINPKDATPHSVNELLYRKAGSLKVIALKALINSETDHNTKLNDLTNIAQNANDLTIIEISTAAYEALKQGRSFFKDFSDGVDTTMPE